MKQTIKWTEKTHSQWTHSSLKFICKTMQGKRYLKNNIRIKQEDCTAIFKVIFIST